MPRVVLRPQAEADLRDIQAWYEAQEPGLGEAFLDVIDGVLVRIAEFPESFPRLEGEMRRALLPRFPYGLFYRLRPDAIEVLACFHHRREPDTWRRGAAG